MPPVRENTPHLPPPADIRGGVRGAAFAMSSVRARHANCSVVGCRSQHKGLYSVPAAEEQKSRWLRFIFNDRAPATVPVGLFVCANHFTADCFSNQGQYKAGFASTLTLVKGSVPTIRDPAAAPEAQVSLGALTPAVGT